MAAIGPLPMHYRATCTDVHRLATHVLARARADHGGRFGLRATSSGIATPVFGDDDSVVRLAGTSLIVERQTADGARCFVTNLVGATMADAAAAAGVDLSVPFAPGNDAPPVGDTNLPLAIDEESMAIVLSWFALGARILDAILPEAHDPTAIQLWPEHFDLGFACTTAQGTLNLGVSPGDAGHEAPYLYVGPWEPVRPGDADYWNAPFGSLLTSEVVFGSADPVGTGVDYFRRGLELMGGD